MMGEGWDWVHLMSVGVVFAAYFVWLSYQEQKR
jgi:hypothetical protein